MNQLSTHKVNHKKPNRKDPNTHFVTNRQIMLTNTPKIKTKKTSQEGLSVQLFLNFRQEIKKNVSNLYNLIKNTVYLQFK